MYIYIYIERERERESNNNNSTVAAPSEVAQRNPRALEDTHIYIYIYICIRGSRTQVGDHEALSLAVWGCLRGRAAQSCISSCPPAPVVCAGFGLT